VGDDKCIGDDGDRGWTIDLELARIAVRHEVAYTVVQIDGEMDASNRATVRDTFADAVSVPRPLLVADLSGVAFIDSSSISLLLTVARELEHRRWTFRMVAPPGGQVRRVFDLMGIFGASISDSVDDAVGSGW
jgi:anti-anti-sigma factor